MIYNTKGTDLHRLRVTAFVPGDGCQPSTACTLALTVPSAWRIYSIDPALSKFDAAPSLAGRVSIVPTTLEAVDPSNLLPEEDLQAETGAASAESSSGVGLGGGGDDDDGGSATVQSSSQAAPNETELYVILAVHCHAPLTEFWHRLPPSVPKVCVSLPCCADHGWLTEAPVCSFVDPEIPSGANTIHIYHKEGEASS